MMLFGRQKDKSAVSKKMNKKMDKKITEAQKTDFTGYRLVDALEENVGQFKEIFRDDDTLVVRHFANQHVPAKCCILFVEGMVNNEIINENIIQPIVENAIMKNSGDIIEILQNQVICSNIIENTADISELANAIIRGNTVLFSDGSPEGLILNSKGWQSRPILEPETERIIRGPREGFNESIMMNLTMIRRKLETTNLKMKYMTMGVRTNTKICICYIEGIVNHKILDEVYKRLNDIHLDGILASGYIQELIQDSPYSLFETIGSTERPDIVAAKLLEGRIAIVVDGTPVVLTVPYLFIENFQSNEDYYTNFYYSSIGRLLRVAGFWITVSVPAIYSALVTFHQEAIPTPLLLSISAARQGVPFPTIVEITLLLFIFEMMREAGIRMPSNVGQALSIVGALVLGQASVEARIVSAPIVIVVSITAITGLIITKVNGAVIILRIVFLLLSAFVGLYGYIFGVMGFLLHLCEIRSFGVPYLLQLTNLDPDELKDTVIRVPWWYMRLRPKFIADNRVRQVSGDRKK